mgnify:CR=1 FL=1
MFWDKAFFSSSSPFLIASRMSIFKGELDVVKIKDDHNPYGNKMLFLGLGSILFVPFFKVITHLPPYVGMMLSLAFVSTIAEVISNKQKNITHAGSDSDATLHHSPVHLSLSKIELPSILFFLGILMAVGALESLGILFNFAGDLTEIFPNTDVLMILFGFLSAIIDNVPLVAGAMGMYPIANSGFYAVDGMFWEFLAYCAGTGGSVLIIGSAAGVAVMGILKIDFIWYLKNISFLALLGYISGAITYILLQ